MNELSGSGIGSLVENKIKKNIELKGYEIRYFWNFTSKESNFKNNNDKQYIFDFNNFKKINLEYDDIKFFKITNYKTYYYIIPGSQTNRSLDSAILQPSTNNSFNMIFLQITKHKIILKKKEEYIADCFKAKGKFESSYNIKADKVYLYFILAEDFPNEDTRIELETKNIAYFYYSIKDDIFKDKEGIIDLEVLNNKEGQISQQIEDNEYRYFDSKLTLINIMEKFLQKKTRFQNGIKITESSYEEARKYLFKKTSNIILDPENKDIMTKIVKGNNQNYCSKLITFKFVFTINLNEFYSLKKKDYLIGIIINSVMKNKKEEKLYHFIYMGDIYPDDENLSVSILKKFIKDKGNERIRIKPIKEDYMISEIPTNLYDRIFVFKIYR